MLYISIFKQQFKQMSYDIKVKAELYELKI